MMPNSRREFEHNMHLLSESFEKDLVKIKSSNIRTIKGIKNARYSPNKRVNLNTVDEMARLLANTIAETMDRKELENEENGKE